MQAQAVRSRAQTAAARHDLAKIEAPPITQATWLLRDRTARATTEQTTSGHATQTPRGAHRPYPEREFGPSL